MWFHKVIVLGLNSECANLQYNHFSAKLPLLAYFSVIRRIMKRLHCRDLADFEPPCKLVSQAFAFCLLLLSSPSNVVWTISASPVTRNTIPLLVDLQFKSFISTFSPRLKFITINKSPVLDWLKGSSNLAQTTSGDAINLCSHFRKPQLLPNCCPTERIWNCPEFLLALWTLSSISQS